MKDVTEEQRPDAMAEKIFKHLIDPYKIENQQIVITASIGWSEYGKDGTEFNELVDKAKEACAVAHNSGKNRYAVYGGEAVV